MKIEKQETTFNMFDTKKMLPCVITSMDSIDEDRLWVEYPSEINRGSRRSPNRRETTGSFYGRHGCSDVVDATSLETLKEPITTIQERMVAEEGDIYRLIPGSVEKVRYDEGLSSVYGDWGRWKEDVDLVVSGGRNNERFIPVGQTGVIYTTQLCTLVRDVRDKKKPEKSLGEMPIISCVGMGNTIDHRHSYSTTTSNTVDGLQWALPPDTVGWRDEYQNGISYDYSTRPIGVPPEYWDTSPIDTNEIWGRLTADVSPIHITGTIILDDEES